jgi:hypothetical protein
MLPLVAIQLPLPIGVLYQQMCTIVLPMVMGHCETSNQMVCWHTFNHISPTIPCGDF